MTEEVLFSFLNVNMLHVPSVRHKTDENMVCNCSLMLGLLAVWQAAVTPLAVETVESGRPCWEAPFGAFVAVVGLEMQSESEKQEKTEIPFVIT